MGKMDLQLAVGSSSNLGRQNMILTAQNYARENAAV